MGKQTKNFRQSAQLISGNRGAQTYGQINRMGSGYAKIANFVKVRGKIPTEVNKRRSD